MGCPFCHMKKLTTWYADSPEYCIVECVDCGEPMIVLKKHGAMSEEDYQLMQRVADGFMGGEAELYEGHGRVSNEVHPHFHIRKKKRAISRKKKSLFVEEKEEEDASTSSL